MSTLLPPMKPTWPWCGFMMVLMMASSDMGFGLKRSPTLDASELSSEHTLDYYFFNQLFSS